MRVSDFDYELPESLIAQEALAQRDSSRMMVVDRTAQTFHDSLFREFPSDLREGDVVVLNNTKVFPARLVGERLPTGGHVELLLLREVDLNVWEALARPARRLREGERVRFDGAEAEVLECLPEGKRLITFECEGALADVIERIGQTPLPPYIKRNVIDEDRTRYQTVYAKTQGAIAAPTAGLHFTDDTIDRMHAVGARLVEITLHVGYGTFEPVRVDDMENHKVAAEQYVISDGVAEMLNRARTGKQRIIAIGTTTTRALESATDVQGRTASGPGTAGLTIVPGYRFRAVDALLTNFHLPRSSLLMLVSAFAGTDLLLGAYRHAVEERYRFYSYGDCMLIT